MDSVFKLPASPGTPLFPVSPERANRQQLPISPSRQSDFSSLHNETLKGYHSRNSSDVQGKVAQFNNLSKEASQKRKDNEAALKRAVVGREEAECETRRLKEENGLLQQELEDSGARERKVSERMEAVKEEIQRLKDTQAHSQSLYEKEVRRARKEAFKSSSALVKLQEELKNTRNRLSLVKEDYEIQRKKVENRAQEAFTAQYELVGVQEELEEARRRMQVMEEERDALKTSLKEEEVARVAAEGKISLPVAVEPDEFSSPRKPRRESAKENVNPEVFDDLSENDELAELKGELRREKKWRIEAQNLIKFMHIECQFGHCSCQIAKSQGRTYVYDDRYDSRTASLKTRRKKQPSKSERPPAPATPPIKLQRSQQENKIQANVPADSAPEPADIEPLIEFSPTTGTFRTIPSPVRQPLTTRPTPCNVSQDLLALAPPLNPIPLSGSPSLLDLGDRDPAVDSSGDLPTDHPTTSPTTTTTNPTNPPIEHVALHPLPPLRNSTPSPKPSTPSTPPPAFPTFTLAQRPQTISRIVTTTTTIPLADPFSPAPPRYMGTRDGDVKDMKEMPYSPASTMTREQALEQIRQRRGRARSIAAGNATPRKLVLDARRDISAPMPGTGRRGR